MKVSYVIESLAAGGAEALLLHVANAAKSDGRWDPTIICLRSGGEFRSAFEKQGIPVVDVGARARWDLPTLVGGLSRAIDSVGAQIVHTHLFPADYCAVLANLSTRSVLIHTQHGIDNRRRGIPLIRPLERLIYRRFSTLICVSRSVEMRLVEWLPDVEGKTVVIPNAIPPAHLQARQGTPRWDVVVVGRLVQEKGHKVLFKALAKLKEDGLWLTAAIAGDGPLYQQLVQHARELGIHDQIAFLGHVDDVEGVLNAGAIFVLPSIAEGLPMALLEAMAFGKCVVASAVGGVPEAIRHGENGLLTEPGNTNALAESILQVHRSAAARNRLGAAAKATVQRHFGMGSHLDSLYSVYDHALWKR